MCAVSARAKSRPRSASLGQRERYATWHKGMFEDLVRAAEIRDKRAWAEQTFPGIDLGHKRTRSTSTVTDIDKLKHSVPLKLLRQLVTKAELRDYRVKAQTLTPKGEYYGMKNFLRALSDSAYFSKKLYNNFPIKSQPPSLNQLVAALDDGAFDDVFIEHGLDHVPPNMRRKVKSESELRWRNRKLILRWLCFSSANTQLYSISIVCSAFCL